MKTSPTTTAIVPGQSFILPAGATGNITVNAATSGHKFSVIVVQPKTPFPPIPPTPSVFPPPGPLTVLKTKKAYLYTEYNDDDDLQAFFASYNLNINQQYLDWFNNANLPIYTSLSGLLLDWVAEGLYGQYRPSLSSGQNTFIGPYNTFTYNEIPYNTRRVIGPDNIVATSDDIFKRIITWNTWKGDGRTFNVRWLKRRLMRFLIGVNGSAPNVDNTWQISVVFGLKNQINITFITQTREITESALYNANTYNEAPITYNYWKTAQTFNYPPLPNVQILEEALNAGVLQLPFQYDFKVAIQ